MSWLEEMREQAAKFNAEVRARAKVERSANRAAAYAERERVRKAKWQKAHREYATAYLRLWRNRKGFDNNAYQREWSRNHPGKRAEYSRRYRAKKRGLEK